MKNELLPILLASLLSLPGLTEEVSSSRLVRLQVATVGADLDHVSELYRPLCLRDGENIDLVGEKGRIRIRISVRAGGTIVWM
jgi:hypothetical protein